MTYPFISILYDQYSSRQTGEYAPQFLQHDCLLSRIRICLSDSVSHTDTGITPRRINNRGLSRKPGRSTCIDILCGTARCAIDPGQDELEVGRR